MKLGYLKITIPKEHKNSAMNAILQNQLSYKRVEFTHDSSIQITIKASMQDEYKTLFEKEGVLATFGKVEGAVAYLSNYKARLGLIIGVFMVILSVYCSSLFIWRIDIVGNETLSKEEILSMLEDSECYVGAFIPKINYDSLHNRVILNSPSISWISVNIKGNVATVMIRESEKEKPQDSSEYANIVSKYDAQIVLVKLFEGEKKVFVGDTVKKGDLLISGIMDSQSLGTRYVEAKGSVMGYVNKSISVKIPLQYEKKVYQKDSYIEKNIKIFNKSIKFSLKGRNEEAFCDKIIKSNRVKLFGKIEVPIEITTTEYLPYESQDATYTYNEAVDIAFSRLREELDIALADAQLISKSIRISYDSENVYIDCDLYCIESIGEKNTFHIN
ncbi:MAG: sporulation protein YqfD [Clostridia bacterium]|nr:sporulation protein YqfD [Clostridia bacterium]